MIVLIFFLGNKNYITVFNKIHVLWKLLMVFFGIRKNKYSMRTMPFKLECLYSQEKSQIDEPSLLSKQGPYFKRVQKKNMVFFCSLLMLNTSQ